MRSSARRLVCIFFKSLSKWRLPCALLRDDSGLDRSVFAEKQTRLRSSPASVSDLLLWIFVGFFMTLFFNSCNAQQQISLYTMLTLYSTKRSQSSSSEPNISISIACHKHCMESRDMPHHDIDIDTTTVFCPVEDVHNYLLHKQTLHEFHQSGTSNSRHKSTEFHHYTDN